MPLIHSSSKQARSENIKELINSSPNRPIKQAVAIAYSVERESEASHKERHDHEKNKYGS